jgi:hypothetical protein
LLQPFLLAVLQFQFFDLKPNSLQSCCLRAIVISLCVINLVLNLFNIYFGFMDFMFSLNQKTSHFIAPTTQFGWLSFRSILQGFVYSGNYRCRRLCIK